MTSFADKLFDLTNAALETCSEQQRIIYQLVHGITITGTTHPRSIESVARALDLSRSAARWHLAMAELAIYKHIARTLVEQLHAEHADTQQHTPTIADYTEHGMSIRTRDKQTYSSISLGEGSDQMLRASRIGPADARSARYQQLHERYAGRPDSA